MINDETPSHPVESDMPVVVEHSWKSCAICLEEMADSDLRQHTSCTCLLCQSCIEVRCFFFVFLSFLFYKSP